MSSNPKPFKQILTTSRNYKNIVEYDEIHGKDIYGWSLVTGDALYKAKIGILKNPPPFKNAGPKWRKILKERWEQRSIHQGTDTIRNFTGVFKFNRTRRWIDQYNHTEHRTNHGS